MSLARKILRSLVVLASVAACAGAGTYAAFSGATTAAGNGFTAGTVAIGDNDTGASVVSLAAAVPVGRPGPRSRPSLRTASVRAQFERERPVAGAQTAPDRRRKPRMARDFAVPSGAPVTQRLGNVQPPSRRARGRRG